MNTTLRRSLSALALVAAVALALGAAAATGLSLRDARANVDALRDAAEALKAREKRVKLPAGQNADASPLFEARTITLAGAALQQRLEAAIAAAQGQLISSKLDVSPNSDRRRIALSVDFTIAEPKMQTLLFDLETGRPYLFVDAFEARSSGAEGGRNGAQTMRVSLNVSGQWSARK